jgi:SAM-dependent methyltransferase
MNDECPLCKQTQSRSFFELREMPVSIGVQWASAEEARACRKGDLHLAFCRGCGFIWNRAFDPGRLEYSQRYDNSLDFSPVFQDYARGLAQRLIETYDIRDKEVVELGCGKGHFLTLLCEAGGNRGIGFDPSFEGDRIQSPAAGRITYVADFYGEKYTGHRGDLICCRHVLEHIPDPVGFLSMVRRTIGDRDSAIVYFEVPNVRFILEQHSIWDIIYEHCNYFSRESLAHTFRGCGFEVVRLEESYSGQFLSLEARLADPAKRGGVRKGDTAELDSDVQRFSEQVRERSQTWQDHLKSIRHDRQRAVIWGGGAKAVSFLNLLKIGDEIPHVVDINPHKQGRHLPGTGQKIVAPDFLQEFQPQVVILMNPIYRNEVEAQLKGLGIAAEVLEA